MQDAEFFRVSIGTRGIWALLAPGKKCHYCVDVSSSSEMLLTWLFSKQKNYTSFPHDTLEVAVAVQKGSFPHNKNLFNFDPSILWCLVFVRRRPSMKGTLDLHSRVVLLVRFLRLCAIPYFYYLINNFSTENYWILELLFTYRNHG